MKKLIALALTMVAAHGAFAQGTVSFQNGITSFITTNNGASGRVQASMGLTASLYWGTSSDNLSLAPGGAVSFNASSPGLIAGNVNFAINGAPVNSLAFFQVRVSGTDSAGTAWTGQTEILPFQLGPNPSPGTVMFSSGTPQTAPAFFHAFSVTPVPEPSTIALAGLGAASLLLFRRRK